jgi:hypothetical protein
MAYWWNEVWSLRSKIQVISDIMSCRMVNSERCFVTPQCLKPQGPLVSACLTLKSQNTWIFNKIAFGNLKSYVTDTFTVCLLYTECAKIKKNSGPKGLTEECVRKADGGASQLGRFTREGIAVGTLWVGGRMVLRAGRDALEKSHFPLPEIEHLLRVLLPRWHSG